jgi:t-SNARE complex subunit (syntaxin)
MKTVTPVLVPTTQVKATEIKNYENQNKDRVILLFEQEFEQTNSISQISLLEDFNEKSTFRLYTTSSINRKLLDKSGLKEKQAILNAVNERFSGSDKNKHRIYRVITDNFDELYDMDIRLQYQVKNYSKTKDEVKNSCILASKNNDGKLVERTYNGNTVYSRTFFTEEGKTCLGISYNELDRVGSTQPVQLGQTA